MEDFLRIKNNGIKYIYIYYSENESKFDHTVQYAKSLDEIPICEYGSPKENFHKEVLELIEQNGFWESKPHTWDSQMVILPFNS